MPQTLPSFPEMQGLLRRVSRSFYLSIRLLPGSLRRPIAIAYLLARASDTLADSVGLPVAERLAQLEALAAAIDGRPDFALTPAHLARRSGALTQDEAERRLLAALPYCLEWLQVLEPADRDDIRTVLRHITQGQAQDIRWFGAGTALRALDSAAQLDAYTYQVAGCVGEFWTDLCFRHLPAFAALPPEQMRALGRSYGMGLQLVNILRDCGEDLAAGRCYFPADQLAAAGLAAHNILREPERFEPLWQQWHLQAGSQLEQGMLYARAVNSRRVRAASALPALLGVRTLALVQAAGPARLQHKVKMPRSEVRNIMARMAISLAGRAAMEAQFRRLCGPASGSEWDNRAP